ncbi:hypothetical protein Tco_0169523 [Tanacetum coccineum]
MLLDAPPSHQLLRATQPASTSTAPPSPTEDWLTADAIIKKLVYHTISEPLLKCVLKAKPKILRDAWEILEKIVTDNKRSKTDELVGELRDLDIGDLTVDAYFRKIDPIASRLINLGSNVTDEDLVTYAIHGLSEKYDQVAHIILTREPFPDLEKKKREIEVPSHSNARSVVSYNFVSSDVDVESSVPSGTVLYAFAEEIVAYEKDSNESHVIKNLNALSTPESFVTHSNFDTPGGTVYYIPRVSKDVLLVKRTVYDSVEDCVVAYMKYAAEAGFVVRRSCQERMLNGDFPSYN